MKIYADIEDIWKFIQFLYHFKEYLKTEETEKNRKISYYLKKIKEWKHIFRNRIKTSEEIFREEQEQWKKNYAGLTFLEETLCEEKRKLARYVEDSCTAVQQAIRSLDKVLQYLESLTEEDDYIQYCKAREEKNTSDYQNGYVRMDFRGNSFWSREEDFDFDAVDEQGRSNLERMLNGIAPLGHDGKEINLHHMIQKESGGIIEIPYSMHKGNHGKLHINTSAVPSGINRDAFTRMRKAYWKRRAAFEIRGRR